MQNAAISARSGARAPQVACRRQVSSGAGAVIGARWRVRVVFTAQLIVFEGSCMQRCTPRERLQAPPRQLPPLRRVMVASTASQQQAAMQEKLAAQLDPARCVPLLCLAPGRCRACYGLEL
jgi:hypothetical protein